MTFVLFGAYCDKSPNGDEIMHPGKIRYRSAEHQHCVQLLTKDCWTFLITGREKRKWGFWVNGKFRKRNKYFYEWGHHTSDQKGIRLNQQ